MPLFLREYAQGAIDDEINYISGMTLLYTRVRSEQESEALIICALWTMQTTTSRIIVVRWWTPSLTGGINASRGS
jgi:hypothetical protein